MHFALAFCIALQLAGLMTIHACVLTQSCLHFHQQVTA